MKYFSAVCIVLSLSFALPAIAVDTKSPATSPAMTEAQIIERTETISKGLRCVVCQNQSIADSESTLAEDMRSLVEKRVRIGETDDEVRTYMQDRYGDFILMKPPFKPYTVLLWFGPFLLLAGGGYWYWRTVQARKLAPETTESFTPDEAERLKAIMKDDTT